MERRDIALNRLRQAIRTCLVRNSITAQDVEQWAEWVAPLVLGALGDEDHSLARMLGELQQLIAADAAATPPRRGRVRGRGREPRPARRAGSSTAATRKVEPEPPRLSNADLLCPVPGTSCTPLGACWPLQLLLLLTAWSSRGERLCEFLQMNRAEWEAALKQAAQRTEVRSWSCGQYGGYCLQALEWLEEATATPTVVLQGRELVCGARRVSLSRQQAIFLACLERAKGAIVPVSDLQTAGVKTPARVKHDLMDKLQEAGFSVDIIHQECGYRWLQ